MATATPVPPPYTPAPYLVNASCLSTAQLVSQFQDFCISLEHISTSPALVFERLVANLVDALKVTLKPEVQQRSDASEYHNEWKILRKENNQRKSELLRGQVQAPGPHVSGDSIGTVKSDPNVGSFHTLEVVPESQDEFIKQMFPSSLYSKPPGVVVGLRSLYITKHGSIFMCSYPTDIQNDGFAINISRLSKKDDDPDDDDDDDDRAISCSWLEVGSNDPDFQLGTFSTQDDHPISHRQAVTRRRITFSRPYENPPKVVVWISAFYMPRQGNYRIKTDATDITTTGFTLSIDTGNNFRCTVTASWVSCTEDKPNVCIGSFSSLGSRNRSIEFARRDFVLPPSVLLAIKSFEINCFEAVKLDIDANVKTTGMDCYIDYAGDDLVSAEFSYIALG